MPVIVQQKRKRALRIQMKRTDTNSCYLFLIFFALMAAPIVSALLALKASITLNENDDFIYHIITGRLLISVCLMHSNSECHELDYSIVD